MKKGVARVKRRKRAKFFVKFRSFAGLTLPYSFIVILIRIVALYFKISCNKADTVRI